MRLAKVRPGLVSVTFRALSPVQIIELALQSQLEGIEWGGDVHVPPSDLAQARIVGQQTRDAGLSVAAYGSYYRLGQADDPAAFVPILEITLALRAPLIRVWAGTASPQILDEAARRRIIEDAQHCAELGAQAGVKIALEFHRGTLTESAGSALRFLSQVGHPNLRTLWQPIYWMPGTAEAVTQSNAEDLSRLKPYIENIHVFHWTESPSPHAVKQPPTTQRWPLEEGKNAWTPYLRTLAESSETAPVEHFALLEFVCDDDPQTLLRDAVTLRSWLQKL